MSYLNVSSREKLDMDLGDAASSAANSQTNNKSSHNASAAPTATVTFNRRKGLFIELWAIAAICFIVLCLLVGVGLLVGLTSNCETLSSSARPGDNESVSTSDTPAAKPYVRLPTSVVPESYSVVLQPFIQPDLFYFDGNVSIIVSCKEDTDNITLHINDLIIANETIELVELSDGTGVTSKYVDHPEPKSFEHDVYRQFFTIKLSAKLKRNRNYRLSMEFKGNLNDDLVGFYRSSYNDTTTGEQRWLAVTQFQPTDARRAFPCFDEPVMKATFNITLIHWKNMTAISNMPIESSIVSGDWVTDAFQTTVRMSTYLLAFVVGHLSHKRSYATPPDFTVWSQPSAIESAGYALSIGPRILNHYETYFNISFPLPKMDMAAVPDFNAGAMENWGLIVYRETAMLYDPEMSSTPNLQRVATVVAHELAHQWFGNLVTPRWWDDLWLNEGFASYMEYEGVDSVHKDWHMHDQFVVDEVHDVFELDCLTSSHPISVKVYHPDEINEIFDRISYGKGASIIRMMDYFLTHSIFKSGVSNYLTALKFNNSEQDDLWRFLTDAQKGKADNIVDVKMVMDSWTLQDGYPVVTLTRNYTERSASLSQKRFLLAGSNETIGMNMTKYKWEIPITYTDSSKVSWQPNTKLWMHKDNSEPVDIPESDVPTSTEWMMANLQEVGYYRVNYDEANWKLIIDQLNENHELIHQVNRAQILDDALDLARAGLIDYRIALNTTVYLTKEKKYIPWEAARSAFMLLDRMLRRTSLYGEWKKYVLKLITPLYEQYGWTNYGRDLLSQYTQNVAHSLACKYGHEGCVSNATKLYKDWIKAASMNKTNPINPNIRNVVYCTAIEYGSQSDWDFAWKEYLKTTVASEKDKLMKSLACSREPWILSRYMGWAFNESSGIRKQDGSYAFRSIAYNNYGTDLAFNYLRDKWDHVLKYYGKSFFSFGNLIKSVTSSLYTKFELKEVTKFYDSVKDKLGTAQRAFRQAIEQTETNVEWSEKYFATIEVWINNWSRNN